MLRLAGAVIILTALAGCAGARVTDVASVNAAGAPPAEILVDMSVAPMADGAQANVAEEVGAKLQAKLVQRLTEAKIIAGPFVPGASHPGSAVLHVSVVEADPGSLAERFVIGFGVGRATLRAEADLESADAAGTHAMTAFNTSSNSGYKPGLILPGGIALVTRDVVHLAIGGAIDVAANVHGGLDRPVKGTASAIISQLKTYYASVGWRWPAGDHA